MTSTTDPPPPSGQVSGQRGRTRRAILAAAASVLARHRGATLADIAEAADVGRSTLHRHFADRDALIRATVEDSLEAIGHSTAGAALDEGPPREAMRRLVAAMVDVGDRIMFLWGDARVLAEHGPPPDRDDCEGDVPAADDPVLALIRRGQDAGAFDPAATPGWIRHVLWALVFTGLEEADRGGLPRHGVTATVVRTFENGVGPPRD